jgi:hypothetical protein
LSHGDGRTFARAATPRLVEPETLPTPKSPRHLDPRASAPDVPKDSDTSAPKLQRSGPLRASRANSLKPRCQEPRRAPNTSSPRTRPPNAPKGLEHLDSKEPRRQRLRRAFGTSTSVNLWRIKPQLLHAPSTSTPPGSVAPKSSCSARLRRLWCARTRDPQHRRLGEPQRIRIPKNA